MDIFKVEGSHTQRGTKHINKHTTGQERTQEIAPFFAHIPQGKKKTQTQIKKDNNEKQPEQSRTKRRKTGQKAGKEIKRKANKGIN